MQSSLVATNDGVTGCGVCTVVLAMVEVEPRVDESAFQVEVSSRSIASTGEAAHSAAAIAQTETVEVEGAVGKGAAGKGAAYSSKRVKTCVVGEASGVTATLTCVH